MFLTSVMNTTTPTQPVVDLVPQSNTNARKRKARRKTTKKQKRLKQVNEIADQLKAQGWHQLDRCPIRFKEMEVISKVLHDNNQPLSPLQCFKRVWTNNIHQQWINSVRAQVPYPFRALQLKNIEQTGWKYLGWHFNLIARPAPSLRENFYWLDKLKNHLLYEHLHTCRGSLPPFTLASQLSDSFCSVVRIGSHVAIDEIIAESDLDDPAVTVVPRKPHPKGVVFWGAGIKVQHDAPFVIRLVTKTKEFLDWKTCDVVKNLVDPIQVDYKINFTMDSWFDSASVKEYFGTTKHYYTIGAHSGRDKSFWDWACSGLLPNQWRQFANDNSGVLASVFSDTAVHCCTSTAYRKVNPLNQALERCPLSEAYKAHFNYIDLFDRNFYVSTMPHRSMTIECVLFDAFLHVALINAMVIYNSQEGVDKIKFKDWTLVVCEEIFQQ